MSLRTFLKTRKLIFVFFSLWIIYFAFFWSNALYFDKLGNFWAGHVNIWGDWAAHFTMATAMSQRGLLLTQSPFLIGAHFSYPFGADLISAFLIKMGMPLILSFVIPSFLFSLLFIICLVIFYKTLFQSSKIALLATTLFLCNGGIGFYYFFRDVFQSSQPWITFLNPLHEYTRIDEEGIRWISVIDSMVIPQRSFALGFSGALLALALIFTLFFKSSIAWKKRYRYFAVIGLLIGFLPILHTHSFLAVFIFLCWWTFYDLFLAQPQVQKKHFLGWIVVAISTSLIAIPLIKIFFITNVNENFFQLYPGWMASDFHQNWLIFTWKNWGITPLLAIISFIFLLHKSKLKTVGYLLLPSFLLFVLANIFLFQPWVWDNTKLLVWFLLGSSGAIAYFLSQFYQLKSHFFPNQKVRMWIVVILFFLLTASGIIDTYRILLVPSHSYMMYSATEMKLAEWAKTNTATNSIWVTGNQHNHWLFNLTGRQSLMTYPGWLWTQGYNYLPVQHDVENIYKGTPFSLNLLQEYNVNYVVIGESERKDLFANELFFAHSFPVIYQLGTTKIYQIK